MLTSRNQVLFGIRQTNRYNVSCGTPIMNFLPPPACPVQRSHCNLGCPPCRCPVCEIRITGPRNGSDADPTDPITGKGTPLCRAELYIDGVFVGYVPIDANGNWIYRPPTPWAPGRHCVRAILRCANDTSTYPPEDTSCFQVPGGPEIQITGPDDGGNADPEDPVTGTGEPGCEAELFIDGIPVGRVPIDANGNWIYEPPIPWTGGRHCVRAILRCPDDTSPNPPEDTSCFDVIVPPCQVPDIDIPENLAVIPTGQPSITGRGIPSSTVSVCLQDAQQTTLFCQNAHVFEDGEWGIQSPIVLPDGTYTVIATQLGANCIPAEAYRSFSVFTIDTSFFEVNLISLRRGPVFRTVDTVMTVNTFVPRTLDIYYVLLVPGLPIPTPAEIAGYNNAATLTDGGAVRGRFTIPINPGLTTLPFTLTGKENILPLPLETGVMDGFNYDIYVTVSVDGGATLSGVLSLFESAIGMPFASGNGVAGSPFFVRMCTPAEMAFYPDLTQGNPGNRAGVTENARILDNIEGMQALYDQTGGVHGMPDSLALVYSLDSAFDLGNYASAWGGNGWRPIGNVDAALVSPPLSGGHVFTGIAQTPPGGATINDLTINATATAQAPVLVRGLFGQVQNVNLTGFTLANTFVEASVTGSTNATLTGKIGPLAGYAVGGQISDILLITATINAGRAATGTNTIFVGGMIGLVQGVSDISSITANQITATELTAMATITGGLIGRLDQSGTNTFMQGVLMTQISVNAYQTLGGTVGELNNGISLMSGVTVDGLALTHGGFRVGGIVGTLTANSASVLQNLSVTNLLVGPVNPPTTTGYCGGLIGNTTQTAPLTVQDSEVLTGVINSGGRVGGAFGSLNVGAAGFVVRNVGSAADTRPNNGPAGGFIGRIDINTQIASALLVENCRVTAATLTVTSTNPSSAFVGGFVGMLSAGSGASGATTTVLSFVDCFTAASVSHPFGTNTGGFVGSAAISSYLRCRATGSVIANQNVGGFCGNGAGNSAITDPTLSTLQFVLCQARGNVTGTDTRLFANVATGGLIGSVAYALVDRCFASGTAITAGDDTVAGLVGQSANRLLIQNCYALGAASSPNDTVGGLMGTGAGTQIDNCYATGAVTASSGAGGLIASLSNSGSDAGRLAASLALNPSVTSTTLGARTHRVCALLGSGAQLVSNFALSTMTLTAGGVPVIPVSDPNGLDGQSLDPANLLTTITTLGWNTTTVWDTSTIATLGRPTLFNNPEA